MENSHLSTKRLTISVLLKKNELDFISLQLNNIVKDYDNIKVGYTQHAMFTDIEMAIIIPLYLSKHEAQCQK